MTINDSLNMLLEIATIQFFSKDIHLKEANFKNIDELVLDNLPYNIDNDEWLAKMLRKYHNLSHISLEIILNYVKEAIFFTKERRNYKLRVVEAQIKKMLFNSVVESNELAYSINCDLIFRKKLITELRKMGIEEDIIEEGIEKNAVWWRETLMKRAFDNQFECVIVNGVDVTGPLHLEEADLEHKEKWLKLRRYEYYQRHKNSVDKFGEVTLNMLISNKELSKLKRDLAKMNKARLVRVEKFKEATNWKSLYVDKKNLRRDIRMLFENVFRFFDIKSNKKMRLYPTIIYREQKIKRLLNSIDIWGISLKKYLGRIFLELGFNGDVVIELKRCKKVNKDTGYFYEIRCIVNGSDNILLRLIYNNSLCKVPILTFYCNNSMIESTYDFNVLVNDTNNLIRLIERNRYSLPYEGYRRDYSANEATFQFDFLDYSLKISIGRPDYDLTIEEINNGYKLPNEEELIKYFSKLKYPISIVDVFKNICNISLKDNISCYPLISLEYSRCCRHDKTFKTTKKKVIDSIVLHNGDCVEFTRTDNGKTIWVNKDGNWSYSDSNMVSFSSIPDTSKIYYNAQGEYNHIGKNNGKHYNLADILCQVESTRNLAKSLIKDIKKD